MSYEQNSEMLNEEVNDEIKYTEDGAVEDQNEEFDPEQFKALQEEAERMRAALAKANREAKEYRLKAKEFEKAGFTPEELREIREKEERRKLQELERKQDFNKLKETLTSQFQQKEKEYQAQIESLRSSMEKTLIQRDVTSAIAKNEGIEPLLRPHVESRVKLMENEDGTLVARVVDSDGSPMFNAKGEYMTVEEYVATLKEDEVFGAAFRGRGQSGGGTRPAPTNGRKVAPTKRRSEMTDDDVRAFVDEYGWDEFHKLPV